MLKITCKLFVFLLSLQFLFLILGLLVHETFGGVLFFLLPLNIGVFALCSSHRPDKKIGLNLANGFCYWAFGYLILFLMLSIFSNIPGWNFSAFSVFVFAVPVILYMLRRKQCAHFKITFKTSYSYLAILLVLVCIGLLSAIFSYTQRPRPLMAVPDPAFLSLDSLKFITNAPLNYEAGHFPIVPALVSLLSSLFYKHPLYVYYDLAGFIILIHPLVFFWSAHFVTKDKASSLLTAVLSALIIYSVTLDNSFAPGTFMFLLYPLLLCSFIFYRNQNPSFLLEGLWIAGINILLILTIHFWPLVFKTPTLIILISLAIFFTLKTKNGIYSATTVFALVNPLTSLMLSLPLVLLALLPKSLILRLTSKLLASLYIVIIFLAYATYSGMIIYENPNVLKSLIGRSVPIEGWWSYPPYKKIDFLIKNGPELCTYAGLLAIPLVLLFRKKDELTKTLSFFLMLYLSLLIFPEGETYRVYIAFNFLLALFIGLLIKELSELATSVKQLRAKMLISLSLFKKEIDGKVKFSIIVSALIFVFLSGSVLSYAAQNSTRILWRENLKRLTPEGYPTYYATYEVEVAEWFYEKTPLSTIYYRFFDLKIKDDDALFSTVIVKTPLGDQEKIIRLPKTNNTLIVSDPFTMVTLNVLTLRDILIPERVFIYEEEYSRFTINFLQELKNAFLESKNASSLADKIYELKNELFEDSNKDIYIVISERTLTWLNTKPIFTRYIRRSESWDVLSLFRDSTVFELKFVIPEKVYVFHLVEGRI